MRILLYPVLLISACIVQAQDDTLHFSAGTGWNYNAILDEAVSPMIYQGHGYSFQVNMDKAGKRYFSRLHLIYQRGFIQPDLENNSAADLYRGQIDWIRVLRLKTGSGFPLISAGGHLLNTYNSTDHARWANNGFSYCFAISLGPSLVVDMLSRGKNENLHLVWEFSLPLLNYVIRPGISSILPEGTINMGNSEKLGIILGGRLTSIHEYQRLLSRLHMEWQVSSRLSLQIGYQWDLQQYNVNNPFKSVNHLLSASVSYRMTKK